MTARRYVVFGDFDSRLQLRKKACLWAYDVRDAKDQASLLWRSFHVGEKRLKLGNVHSVEPWHEKEHGPWEAHPRDGV